MTIARDIADELESVRLTLDATASTGIPMGPVIAAKQLARVNRAIARLYALERALIRELEIASATKPHRRNR